MSKDSSVQITPALSKDVAFTEKVNAVDAALKSRNDAKKNIKTSWAKVVSLILKHGGQAPARRWDEVKAVNEVNNITIYKPLDKRLADKDAVRFAQNHDYNARQILERTELIQHLDKKHSGLRKTLEDIIELGRLSEKPREEDEVATKKARAEFQAAVDKYIEAIEAYNETVEQVADVREYISVVKDVAEISAIAQGVQKPEAR